MSRTTLQPISRFAFLAVGIHAVLGAALWEWFHRATENSGSPGQKSLTWISPADFQPSRPLTPTGVHATKTEVDAQSMLAVVGVPKPAAPPPQADANHEPVPTRTPTPPEPEPVPKAIAIDPAKALALMKTQPVPAEMPLPPADVSRFITISKRDTTAGKPAGGLLEAAGAEAGNGEADAEKGARLEEVDRAIINALRNNWTPPKPSTLRMDQRTAHVDVSIDRTGRVLKFVLARRSGNDDFDFSVIEATNRLDKIDAQLPPSYPRDSYEFQVHFHVE